MIPPSMCILTDDADSYKWKGTAHLSSYARTLDVPPAGIAKTTSLACWAGCKFHFPSSVDKQRRTQLLPRWFELEPESEQIGKILLTS